MDAVVLLALDRLLARVELLALVDVLAAGTARASASQRPELPGEAGGTQEEERRTCSAC